MSIKLMAEIWPLQFRPKGDKFVLLALADAANDDGVTWIAVRSRKAGKLDLMKKCSMSDRTIQGAIGRLVEQGFLERSERPGKGVLYVVKTTPENSSGLTPEMFAATPENSSGKPLLNHNEKETGMGHPVDNLGSCPLSGTPLPDLLSDEQWQAYRTMRDRIGKPLTSYIANLLLHKLKDIGDLGWHVGDVCDRATVNGWPDFYPPKANKASGIRRVVGKHVGDPVGTTEEEKARIREIDALDDMDEQLRRRAQLFKAAERRNKPEALGDVLSTLPLDFDPRKSR